MSLFRNLLMAMVALGALGSTAQAQFRFGYNRNSWPTNYGAYNYQPYYTYPTYTGGYGYFGYQPGAMSTINYAGYGMYNYAPNYAPTGGIAYRYRIADAILPAAHSADAVDEILLIPGPRVRPTVYPAIVVGKDFDLRQYEPEPKVLPKPKTAADPNKKAAPKTKLLGVDGRGQLEIILPTADAELWLDGAKIKETGKVRRFMSPTMGTGKQMTFGIKASWQADGEAVTREYSVILEPNKTKKLTVSK